VFLANTRGFAATALSVADRRVVGSNMDHTLRVWELDTQECKQVLRGHFISVKCVCVCVAAPANAHSHSQKQTHVQLLSEGWDNMIVLCDLRFYSPLHVFEGHTRVVTTGAP
jgi:WD40 repeat protein